MNKITEAFANKKALIAFVTCGDPDLETTKKVVIEMEKNGADIIELGIPFSDPTAEGPVVEAANARALKQGTTTDKILDMVKDLRKTVKVPLLFMTYANVVYGYGIDRFVAASKEVGIDGLILPEIPFEEKEEFAGVCREHGLSFISLIAPTSNQRIEKIARDAEGFVYCISPFGEGLTDETIISEVKTMVEKVKQANPSIPCAVTLTAQIPQEASCLAKIADGVIIGSEVVEIISQHSKEAPAFVGEYIKAMKGALEK